MPDYKKAIEKDGFALANNSVNSEMISRVIEELESIGDDEFVSQRAGKAFGIRNLLNVAPAVARLAQCESIRALVEPIQGTGARVVRAIFFDKTPVANWKVAWHQDLTIAVRQRLQVEGYGPWSLKAGIAHVQPPVQVLENILALRVQLDDADESNGALIVIPGSHERGRLSHEEIQRFKEKATPVVCRASKGDVLMMRPLLLHASSASQNPMHRRVLHLEYSAGALPSGLEWYGS
jgi:ectoine hydroxylase-related dioxygenase (phytanoyl-CoA dioxygenase family)